MLDVIIVNYRTARLTVECLQSLEPEVKRIDSATVWIVENGSADDSAKQLADAIERNGWQGWARLKILNRNVGFAGGNNAALEEILRESPRKKYVLLLNPDTLVRQDALSELLRFMQEHPKVGIAGSRLEGLDGKIQRSAFRFPSWRGELEEAIRIAWITRRLHRWVVAPPPREIAHPTDWVCGASMIVRREVFDAIGVLDDQYFMYYEEVDFCLRAQQADWPCWYVPASHVVHLSGQSSGSDILIPRRRPIYWFAARRHFFRKNYGRIHTLIADFGWTGGYAAHRLLASIRRVKSPDPPWLWWDFVKYNFGRRR